MRAILVATRGVMRPLVDRPLIQHVVELLVTRSIREIDLIVDENWACIEAILEAGRRWGVVIRHHRTLDPASPCASIRVLAGEGDEPILLAHSDHIVDLEDADSIGDRRTLFMCRSEWTGWAFVRCSDLSSLPRGASRAEVADWLAKTGAVLEHPESLSIATDFGLIEAQRRILDEGFAGLLRTGREVGPSIFIARNVEVHPSARLIAPVHLAEDCHIGTLAVVGPNVAIGSGSVIDSGTTLANTTVCAGTYVGRGLEIVHAIVGPRRMVRVSDGVIVEPDDPTILSEVAVGMGREWRRGILNRVAAIGLIVLLTPFAAIAWAFGSGRGVSIEEVVATPTLSDPRRWKTYRLRRISREGDQPSPSLGDLFGRFWPGLFAVAGGRLAIVGLHPRTVAEMLVENPDARSVALSRRAGLITENIVRENAEASSIGRAPAALSRSETSGIGHDLGLLWGYAVRCLRFRPTRVVGKAVTPASSSVTS